MNIFIDSFNVFAFKKKYKYNLLTSKIDKNYLKWKKQSYFINNYI